MKGKEIAQEVRFIIPVQLVRPQPQLIVLIKMAESNFQEHHINYSNVVPNLSVYFSQTYWLGRVEIFCYEQNSYAGQL